MQIMATPTTMMVAMSPMLLMMVLAMPVHGWHFMVVFFFLILIFFRYTN